MSLKFKWKDGQTTDELGARIQSTAEAELGGGWRGLGRAPHLQRK